MESDHSSPLVLHIEDDEWDAHLVVRCLSHWPKPVRIMRAADGREAIEILQQVESGGHERPHLVLLDLKLPYFNGVEVLRWTRDRESFSDLPVVILTSSDMDSDMEQCHEAGCTEYLVKPMDYLALKKSLDDLRNRHFHATPPEGGAVAYAA